MARLAAERSPPSWAVRALYAVLALSVLSLATLLVGELVYAFEDEGHAEGIHDHGWYGPVFDSAWVVFLLTFVLTLVGAIAALVAGRARRSASASRFGVWGLAYCGLAVLVVVAVETLAA